jgi:putative ABC transport system substrate-binding protein
MNRKLLGLLTLLFLASMHLAEAQQAAKVGRIGVLPGAGDPKNSRPRIQSFQDGLRDLGYDRKNILVKDRYIEKNLDEYPGLISELLQLNVDVVVVEPLAAIQAAKKATHTIPIVIVTSVDPVANGIVESLARPGGNITGIATLSRELAGKRLELFKESVPRISRIGILGDPNTPVWPIAFKEYEAAARALKIQLQSLEVRSSSPDLERAFQTAVKERANGLVMITNPVLGRHRRQIADFAIMNQLPFISDGSGYVEAGFLMSYSTDIPDQYRRAAAYVDKILRGTKPADLPVEQPKKFELVFNLKTAKQIGLTIPPNVLARADKVIK